MNELLFFVQIIICFGTLLILNRLFSKNGVFAYIALAVILANIEVVCQVNMFGLPDNTVVLGNVTFASVFLATDILNECYGYKESKRGVFIGLISAIFFIVMTQLDTLFLPASDSFMHDLFSDYFGINGAFVWVTISSIAMFFLSQLLDVVLFEKIKQKTKGKLLWVRNNVATITANCLENILFCVVGYYLLPMWFSGEYIMPINNALMIALTTSIIEVIISIADTPFLYLAKKWRYKEK